MTAASLKHDGNSAGLDWLTGLPDRGHGYALLAAMLAEAVPGGARVTVFWVDVDRFRQINSSFGHVVGDSVLVELARRLERSRPEGTRLVRMGGDEFALLCPGATDMDADHSGQRIVEAMQKRLSIGTTRMRPSVSVGVALASPEEDAWELLERAERAMVEAKREGGGRCYRIAETTLPERGGKYLAREELSVEEFLHRALETGGLYLNYQPIVRLADDAVMSAEALMRCRVDGRSMAPGRFIPVAEKTGLISHLGDWSLVTAASFLGQLRRQGLELRLAVNVSRVQLQSSGFVRSLHGVVAYTGIDPGWLELEITESLFMAHSDMVRKNLAAAMVAGFSLALDDFGTGYSSLACLKDLPASKIKLDRAFVTDLPHDYRAYGVARAVTQLAGDLGIGVVAEGVETEEQMRMLREAGVTAVQGFLVARPMAGEELIAWLQAQGREAGHG